MLDYSDSGRSKQTMTVSMRYVVETSLVPQRVLQLDDELIRVA
jgi:hypothetical protein